MAVRIPEAVLEAAHWKVGEDLEIEVRDGAVVIQSVATRLTLEELLAGVTPENCHAATDWGSRVGKEEW